VLVTTIIGLAGCAAIEKDIIFINGTVKFVNLEGGFYGIVGMMVKIMKYRT
jgi:hypothetical protein